MRAAEKIVAALIVALAVWTALMIATTNLQFRGTQRNRILLVELGSDAVSLKLAVSANNDNRNDVAHNVQLVLRNTYMDYLFILLYWLTFLSLAYVAGLLGKKLLASISAVLISISAVFDLLENRSIHVAMHVQNFTDAVAVDIWEYSQSKWTFFFLAAFVLGLAMALNRRVSSFRRLCGAVFVAAGCLGLLGITRNTSSLPFAFWMINIAICLVGIALLLTLWKLVQSVKELEHMHNAQAEHAHA